MRADHSMVLMTPLVSMVSRRFRLFRWFPWFPKLVAGGKFNCGRQSPSGVAGVCDGSFLVLDVSNQDLSFSDVEFDSANSISFHEDSFKVKSTCIRSCCWWQLLHRDMMVVTTMMMMAVVSELNDNYLRNMSKWLLPLSANAANWPRALYWTMQFSR